MRALNKRQKERQSGEIMTSREVADFLQMSERTVINHFRKGVLPAKQIGVVWRCRRAALEEYLASGTSQAA